MNTDQEERAAKVGKQIANTIVGLFNASLLIFMSALGILFVWNEVVVRYIGLHRLNIGDALCILSAAMILRTIWNKMPKSI